MKIGAKIQMSLFSCRSRSSQTLHRRRKKSAATLKSETRSTDGLGGNRCGSSPSMIPPPPPPPKKNSLDADTDEAKEDIDDEVFEDYDDDMDDLDDEDLDEEEVETVSMCRGDSPQPSRPHFNHHFHHHHPQAQYFCALLNVKKKCVSASTSLVGKNAMLKMNALSKLLYACAQK